MKKKLGLLTVIILLGCLSSVALAAEEIKVFIDGKQLIFDSPPVVIDGKTMVPMRVTLETLGYAVEWEPTTETITALGQIVADGFDIQVGSPVLRKFDLDVTNYNFATEQGAVKVFTQDCTMDASAKMVGDRVLIPLRAISEQLDQEVIWDENSKTVNIKTAGIITGEAIADESDAIVQQTSDKTNVIFQAGDIVYTMGYPFSYYEGTILAIEDQKIQVYWSDILDMYGLSQVSRYTNEQLALDYVINPYIKIYDTTWIPADLIIKQD